MNLSNYRKLIGTEIAAVIGALVWLYSTSANPADYHTWLYVAIMLLTGFGTWISPPNLAPVTAPAPVPIPVPNPVPATPGVPQ